ncbi:hypothetical protein ACFVZT_31075 [Streptomyces sp. NPDC058321]|uniref:DUF7508 domain-containing protein n=1 Tax=Streptomyces sp. NPDC058321 TaxID=3346445 RepID=UPI0036E0BB5D
MSVEMSKPWHAATDAELSAIPCTTGVYEVREADGTVVDIGYAGARETFGLRSRIAAVVAAESVDRLEFRYECHVQYMTRYAELVLVHRALRGGDDPPRVARRAIPVTGRLAP